MSKTILLADDSLTIQKVVELTFSDTDYKLITTSSGDELLEQLPSSDADIVICDTIMPGLDGYAVCQTIKSDSNTLHIPVILMTGTFEPFDRDRALAAGCSEIITKPFEARNLVETVERLVSGHGVAAPAPGPFAGSVAPPAFGGDTAPPAPDQAPNDFGTMMSSPADIQPEVSDEIEGEGLDFTSTGFAEMEAAAADADFVPDTPPDQGLDFEDSSPEEPEVEEFEPPEFTDPDPTQPIPSLEVSDSADPFAEPAPGMFAQSEEAETDPAVEEPGIAEPEPEPFGATPADQEFEESAEVEVHPPGGFPVDTDPVLEPAFEPEAEIVDQHDEPVEEIVDAPTGQLNEAEIVAQRDDSIEKIVDAPIGQLSEADIDSIARRVVDLAADRLEKIAWDVIPDMAEIIVRERLRELEEEIESAAGTNEPN